MLLNNFYLVTEGLERSYVVVKMHANLIFYVVKCKSSLQTYAIKNF